MIHHVMNGQYKQCGTCQGMDHCTEQFRHPTAHKFDTAILLPCQQICHRSVPRVVLADREYSNLGSLQALQLQLVPYVVHALISATKCSAIHKYFHCIVWVHSQQTHAIQAYVLLLLKPIASGTPSCTICYHSMCRCHVNPESRPHVMSEL